MDVGDYDIDVIMLFQRNKLQDTASVIFSMRFGRKERFKKRDMWRD